MPTLSSFFQLYTIDKWCDTLTEPCKRCFQKYYNASMLQKRFSWNDIYQDAWLKVIENIQTHKITFPKDSEKGNNGQLRFKLYFLLVYRNLLMAKYGQLDGGKYTEIAIEGEIEVDEFITHQEEASESEQAQISLLWAAFHKLTDRCKALLSAKYLGSEKMTGEEIAKEFVMRTPKIAHKKVDGCRARLREIAVKMSVSPQ